MQTENLEVTKGFKQSTTYDDGNVTYLAKYKEKRAEYVSSILIFDYYNIIKKYI